MFILGLFIKNVPGKLGSDFQVMYLRLAGVCLSVYLPKSSSHISKNSLLLSQYPAAAVLIRNVYFEENNILEN